MKILAIDSSATAASVCLNDNGKILAESFMNTKHTHSTTLMPMLTSILKCTGETLNNVDVFAVSSGPGSFTGLRIGVAAVKGMAMAENKMCASVSALEAMAYNFSDSNALVCAVMDARCNQFYNAVFRCNNGNVIRLCDDRALSDEELFADLQNNYNNEEIILVGDGALLAKKLLGDKLPNLKTAPPHLMYQRASGVAAVALKLAEENKLCTASQLLPTYLRLPQAQRELRKKLGRDV